VDGIVPSLCLAREKPMSAPLFRWIALIAVATAVPARATVTINLSTAVDEKNCNKNGSSPNPVCDVSGDMPLPPLSQGCSLREAIANVDNGTTTAFPECTPAPETGPGADNVIDLGGRTIILNSAVPDPVTGMTTYNGTMPDIFPSSSIGKLTIQNGTVQCFVDPVSNDGVRMFHVVGGDLTLKDFTANKCTASIPAIVVQNDSGNTTLTNATIGDQLASANGIHSTGGGMGGCIDHGSGNLTITDSKFGNCAIDTKDSNKGYGGALRIGGVGTTTNAALTNVIFTSNTAGESGGAIYAANTDALSIVNGVFTNNTANGDTFNAGIAEIGGGAIFATNTATGGHALPDIPSHFLILGTVFTLNSAPTGTGGAILLGGGNLNLAQALPPPPWILPPGPGPVAPGLNISIPGGVFDSQFFNNSAAGTWNGVPVDTRAGAGGAIFAHGKLDMLDSSLINNSGSSGGGVALYGSSSTAYFGNVTFNDNTAVSNGGGIANLRNSADNFNGTMSLQNTTVSGNTAASNGGGALYNGGAQIDVVVANTILASSSAGGNCAGPNGITDQTHNLQFGSGTDCGVGMTVGDPMLSAAAPFGGVNFAVFVMQPNNGSAASGNGDPATCSGSPIYNLDAALNTRPSGAVNCDIGAFEYDGPATAPDMTIAKTHSDPFISPSSGDTYTITVSNGGNAASSGTVTVVDTLPAGLTATDISGTGWSCTLATLTCTRSDALAASASYPSIILTVDASSGLSGSVDNSVSVSGGGETDTTNDDATDLTNFSAPPDLIVTKSHSGNFTPGQIGATFTISVSNIGAGASSGTVMVVDTLPAGLAATAIGGTGWNCQAPPTLSCTRSDALAPATAYPAITLTVNVAANPPAQVINAVDVSGGSDGDTSNNHYDDATTLPVTLQSFKVD
jgi:uncharacterized repeat protein (TIGR01451 family)